MAQDIANKAKESIKSLPILTGAIIGILRENEDYISSIANKLEVVDGAMFPPLEPKEIQESKDVASNMMVIKEELIRQSSNLMFIRNQLALLVEQ